LRSKEEKKVLPQEQLAGASKRLTCRVSFKDPPTTVSSTLPRILAKEVVGEPQHRVFPRTNSSHGHSHRIRSSDKESAAGTAAMVGRRRHFPPAPCPTPTASCTVVVARLGHLRQLVRDVDTCSVNTASDLADAQKRVRSRRSMLSCVDTVNWVVNDRVAGASPRLLDRDDVARGIQSKGHHIRPKQPH
jgi:hypothetical protein